MIDTHCHLNFEKFNQDFDQVIEKAKKKGVKKIIVPSSNLETSKKAIFLAENCSNIFASLGIHPIHANEMSIDALGHFYTLLSGKKVVAVGEIGLDYFYLDKQSHFAQYPNKEKQQSVLEQMLKLAQDARLPVILHCRDAYGDLLSVLQKEGFNNSGVIHCFMGNQEEAREFLNLGFLISFTGNITFSDQLDKIVEYIPLEKILIETDAPYLAPVPHRGERNEPAYVIEVARKIAEIKKVSLVEVEKQTDQNAEALFKI